MFMTMISSIKEQKKNQENVKLRTFYMLIIRTKPRDSNCLLNQEIQAKFHNIALIKNKITSVKQGWGYICRFKPSTHIFHHKGERISITRYVHCLCSAKTHMLLNHEQSIQDSFNESIFAMFCHINKWPRQLSIIRAYAPQFTRTAATQTLRSA